MQRLFIGICLTVIAVGYYLTFNPITTVTPPQPTAIHRDLVPWATTPHPVAIEKPSYLVTLSPHSVTKLKYFTVDNQTDMSIEFNTRDIGFILGEYLYDLNISSKTADKITIVLVDQDNFGESDDGPKQTEVLRGKEKSTIKIAVGLCVKILKDNPEAKRYVYFIDAYISDLVIKGFTQLGISNGTYTIDEAQKIQGWYRSQQAVNPTNSILFESPTVLP